MQSQNQINRMARPPADFAPISRFLKVFRLVAWVSAFAVVGVVATAFSCSAQSASCISVRALDYKKGKAVKNVAITIDPSSWKGINAKTVKTDLTGVAKFCLTDPMFADFGLRLDEEHFESCSGDRFKTATIMKIGYLPLGRQCHGETTFRFTENSKPGELVILVRHKGWLERNIDWP